MAELGESSILLRPPLRPPRLSPEIYPLVLETPAGEFTVHDYSSFGISVRSAAPIYDFSQRCLVTLKAASMAICSLELQLNRRWVDGSEHFTAFEVLGTLPIEKVHAAQLASACVLREEHRRAALALLPETIRLRVLETQQALMTLEQEVDALADHAPKTGNGDLHEFEETVATVFAKHLEKLLLDPYRELWQTMSELPLDVRRDFQQFVRDQLGRWLYQAPFAHRSFSKPLGYAGDYEMMNLIYRDQPEGASLFAKCLHRFYIDQPAAKAVRNRQFYLCDKISLLSRASSRSKPLRLLSVASGPAKELQRWLQLWAPKDGESIEIHLLDGEIESLQFAQRRLRTLIQQRNLPCAVHYHHRTIQSVIAHGLSDNSFDLVYSLGLFDYLKDKIALALASVLFRYLAPGGDLIIGNFDVSNPTRPIMELILDWNLIHRSSRDLMNLFSPLSSQIYLDTETEGVNLFCRITKSNV